eukprot:CAMPEP_0206410778 /NCGR_PEP_ID=MMETSP0294-20121207/32806_1 /ASSEMBLY_ACC=CAM_ASM_000327 /TAXON_ID=39354 /ORGANISM="Heterosigma akashiwo, Strain CCMP2393" /LENGTH=204 /DNA_ID=CAMNT_0053871211 /DNA_START=338 /DNA_END=949 /DNA_ORIENTATION=+
MGLMLVILACTDFIKPPAHRPFVGIGIRTLVVAGQHRTGPGMNPMIALGWAWYKGAGAEAPAAFWGRHLAVYLGGAVAGGAAGVLLWRLALPPGPAPRLPLPGGRGDFSGWCAAAPAPAFSSLTGEECLARMAHGGLSADERFELFDQLEATGPTPAAVQQFYDAWGADYDADMAAAQAANPVSFVGHVAAHFPKPAAAAAAAA